jgi:hypothetical protein
MCNENSPTTATTRMVAMARADFVESSTPDLLSPPQSGRARTGTEENRVDAAQASFRNAPFTFDVDGSAQPRDDPDGGGDRERVVLHPRSPP